MPDILSEEHFARFWETTLSPTISQELAAHWRRHELSAVERGEAVVGQLKGFTSLEGKRILDIGCGYGGLSVAMALAGSSVIAVDYDAQRLTGASIRVGQDHPDSAVALAQTAAEGAPFGDATFDLVVCNDVLEHVRSHTQTLAEIARLLKPGGWAYLTFPNRLGPANIRHDPHYDLFGVCLLPPKLGAWYVVRLRKKATSYHVGLFPIASQVIRQLERLGLSVVEWQPAPQRRIGVLTGLLRLYRLNTQPLITLICRKTN